MPSIYTFTQLTDELADTAIFTDPDTVEPVDGDVIFTTDPVGVGVGVGVGETPPVGVGVGSPVLLTVTVTESFPTTPVLLLAVTEIV